MKARLSIKQTEMLSRGQINVLLNRIIKKTGIEVEGRHPFPVLLQIIDDYAELTGAIEANRLAIAE
jgi:hypothetical protein